MGNIPSWKPSAAQLLCFMAFLTKDEGYHCHDTRLVRKARMTFFAKKTRCDELFKMRSSDVLFVNKTCRQKAPPY